MEEGKREKPAVDSVRLQQKVGADGDAIAIEGGGVKAQVRVLKKIK